jgi:hypothetical protein
MNKLFEKIDMVCVLRWTGVILLALYVLQAVLGASRGAGIDVMLKIFFVLVANNLFQPLVLLGIAEGIARMNKA